MEDLHHILAVHAAKYPKMQPTDAVKLLYQNEFGGGHLIRDTEKCLDRLRTEYQEVSQSPAEPLTEEIGNDMIRVNLRALDSHGYSIEQLGADFVRSAAVQQGSMESFLEKLQFLRQLTESGLLPFSCESLNNYLVEYEKAGYPAVSHSSEYRAVYAPAYRIVQQDILEQKNRR